MRATLRTTTSRIVVSSESLPTRLTDLRFMALDHLDVLHLPSGGVPLARDLRVRVVERTERSATVEASYVLVELDEAEPRPVPPARAKQIRDLPFTGDSLTVEIPDLSTSPA